MGSKAKIAKDILPIIIQGRKPGQWYVEPFCGGCNVIDKVDGNRIASDKNAYLIEMWRALVSGCRFNTIITKQYYDEVRHSYRNCTEKFTTAEIGWVGFMGSYNGRFFDGGYSGHHIKTINGGERDYIGENIANTMRQVESLRNVEFIRSSYDNYELLSHIPPESIIYCDPPYKNTKQYSSSINFNHDLFWEWCRLRVREGHKVFVSEQTAPNDFVCVWEKTVKRTINHSVTKGSFERLFVPKEQL